MCDELEIVGCQDENVDTDGNDGRAVCATKLLTDTDGDGVCDELKSVARDTACNYDPTATEADNGTCEYAAEQSTTTVRATASWTRTAMAANLKIPCDELEVEGCTDVAACNYDAAATDDDGTCEYAEEYYDCAGNCLNDADGDGVCDELEVEGCRTRRPATTLTPPPTTGLLPANMPRNSTTATATASTTQTATGSSDELEVDGCTDDTACNFNPDATEDDDTCTFPGDACDDGDDTTINDVLNDECECVGEVDGLDEAVALTWTLYPSPVRDVLNLRLEGGAWSGAIDGDVEVMVLGATGQVLRSERLAGRGNPTRRQRPRLRRREGVVEVTTRLEGYPACESTESEPVQVTINPDLGQQQSEVLNLYPNPDLI